MADIATNLQTLVDDRDDIRTALVAKGVSAASNHGFNDFADDIASIPSGGNLQTGSLSSITVKESSYTNSQTCSTFLFKGDSDLIYFHIQFSSSKTSGNYGSTKVNVDIIVDDYTPPDGSVWTSLYTAGSWGATQGLQTPTVSCSITNNNKFCITFTVGIYQGKSWNLVGGFQRTS